MGTLLIVCAILVSVAPVCSLNLEERVQASLDTALERRIREVAASLELEDEDTQEYLNHVSGLNPLQRETLLRQLRKGEHPGVMMSKAYLNSIYEDPVGMQLKAALKAERQKKNQREPQISQHGAPSVSPRHRLGKLMQTDPPTSAQALHDGVRGSRQKLARRLRDAESEGQGTEDVLKLRELEGERLKELREKFSEKMADLLIRTGEQEHEGLRGQLETLQAEKLERTAALNRMTHPRAEEL